jgi:outer membrane protein TolC
MLRTICLACLLSSTAVAGEVLTLEDAVQRALATNPNLQNAELRMERSGEDVSAALGTFDPTLSLQGGWGLSRDVGPPFPGFPAVVQSRSESWDASAAVSASAPTGTSATVTGTFRGNENTTLNEDGTPLSGEASLFLSPLQRNTVPGNLSLSLTQQLLKGVRLSYNLQNVRRARANETIADLEFSRARQQAIADTARAYWTWVHRAEVARISKESVEVAEENLRVGAARVDAGEAAPVERTRLEAALIQARTTALDAENEAARTADDLLVLMGEMPGGDIEPGTRPGDVPGLELDPARAVDVALEQGFDVAIARQNLELTLMEQANARHDLWPTLSLTGTAGFGSGVFETESDGAIVTADQTSLNVGVRGQFSMPLGNRAAASAARRTNVDVRLAKQSVVDTEGATRAAVHQAVRLLLSAQAKVELADINLQLAQETLAAEEALFDAGRTLLRDVLESRRAVDEAAGEAVRARTDYRVAVIELLRLQGQLDGSLTSGG